MCSLLALCVRAIFSLCVCVCVRARARARSCVCLCFCHTLYKNVLFILLSFVCLYTTDLYNYGYLCIVCGLLSLFL